MNSKSLSRQAFKTALALIAFGLLTNNPLPAAELTTAFPKEQPPLELLSRLGRPFNDNAVFQQQMPIPVWGWTLPGAQVSVAFDGEERSATAGEDGRWEVRFDPRPAGKLKSVNDAPEGRTLTVVTKKDGKEETKTLSNILIGEVWLASGQSNMSVKNGPQYPKNSAKDADYPAMRYLDTEWTVVTPKNTGQCYRISFVFGRELLRELLVPVGVMNAAVAGTGIEGWWYVPPGGPMPETKYQNFIPKIRPLVGFAMRGTLWYQGEANVKKGKDYLPMFQRLIEGWREGWGQGDFPFYYVQLASMGESPTDNPEMGDGRAAIRQAQFEALQMPNTGMAVAIDIGGKGEHPPNKYDVGLRLSRWALHNDYGMKDVVPSGPLYQSHEIEGNTIRVKFEHAGSGLMLASKDGYEPPTRTPDADIPWLSIQDKDGTWHWAEGKINGSDLIVSSKEVRDPIAVRYAYTQHPVGCNLYNKEGLPASPFTTCGYEGD